MCDGNCFECKYDDCIASDKEVLEFAKEEIRKNVEEIAKQPITKRNPGKRKIDWNDYEQVKEYQRVKSRIYYQENKEKCAIRRKKYYQENREKELARRHQYYLEHYEEEKERNKQYRKTDKNKEYQSRYYQKHKEERQKYYKEYRERKKNEHSTDRIDSCVAIGKSE